MNLHRLLSQRAADGKPLRVTLIGAGKFGTMFLAQARRTPGIHVVAVADLEQIGTHTIVFGDVRQRNRAGGGGGSVGPFQSQKAEVKSQNDNLVNSLA